MHKHPKVDLAKNPENFQLKPELPLCNRATRTPHGSNRSAASCSPSSVGQHPLQPGMPALGLVPIAKGEHQELQHDLVMDCGGAGSRRYPNSNALWVLGQRFWIMHRGIMI